MSENQVVCPLKLGISTFALASLLLAYPAYFFHQFPQTVDCHGIFLIDYPVLVKWWLRYPPFATYLGTRCL